MKPKFEKGQMVIYRSHEYAYRIDDILIDGMVEIAHYQLSLFNSFAHYATEEELRLTIPCQLDAAIDDMELL